MTTLFLFPEYRKRVLGLLLLHPEKRFHVREIARLTKTAAGSLHRELAKLAKDEVLIRDVQKNQVLYQANHNFVIFKELVSILKKTSGITETLRAALSLQIKKIEAAFIYGSIANGSENSNSDIDVLIIGTLCFNEAVSAFYSSQDVLGREINPKIYKREEWQLLLKKKNGFVQDILKKPKIFIIGNEHDLE